jgi:S-adenosylmethionine hydrolase
MTDFGIKDGNVGVMKGVIWQICPEAHIADVSHMIGAQDVREAALILARSSPYFPKGTIQLVVVDPGVGTDRRPMAARIGSDFFVGPDNGVITLWLDRARKERLELEFVMLDQPTYWLSEVSHVFHGRDIFAPVAAHIAKGVPLAAVGSPFTDPVELTLPVPRRVPGGWDGEVIHVDHFGNVATNIRAEDLAGAISRERIEVLLGRTKIKGMVNTFGERHPGDTVALLGSTGNLIISVVNGDAASSLGIRVGDSVRVRTQGNTSAWTERTAP